MRRDCRRYGNVEEEGRRGGDGGREGGRKEGKEGGREENWNGRERQGGKVWRGARSPSASCLIHRAAFNTSKAMGASRHQPDGTTNVLPLLNVPQPLASTPPPCYSICQPMVCTALRPVGEGGGHERHTPACISELLMASRSRNTLAPLGISKQQRYPTCRTTSPHFHRFQFPQGSMYLHSFHL